MKGSGGGSDGGTGPMTDRRAGLRRQGGEKLAGKASRSNITIQK